MIFALLAVEISENAKASAFPAACCGVSEQFLKKSEFLTFRRFPAACCRVLQSIGADDLDPFAGHGGMKRS
jgi:hypothetical protein